MRYQILVGQGALSLEEAVVHGPETSLGAGRLGGLRGRLGVRMDVGEREVPVHEPQLVSQPTAHLFDGRVRGLAERTFEIAVLQQGDRGVRRPADVIAFADGQDQARTGRHDARARA